MNRKLRIVLILLVIAGLGVAGSYYIPFWHETYSNQQGQKQLQALHQRPTDEPATAAKATRPPAETESAAQPEVTGAPEGTVVTAAPETPDVTAAPADTRETGSPETDEATAAPQTGATETPAPGATEKPVAAGETPAPEATASAQPAKTRAPTPEPTATPDRSIRSEPLPYPMLPQVTLDPEQILPEMQELYAINNDLIGWLTIPGMDIDYPVVQTDTAEGMDYYLDHDYFGEENRNGVLILDTDCDAFTPSYNLIISGHHLTNHMMFSDLTEFDREKFWMKHPYVTFDTLMERGTYVIVAAFRSAAWRDNERGFRYSANIQYKYECEKWLEQVYANQLYATGVDARWGDEFLTLTTCNKIYHPEGRFVLVCRKLREGEEIHEIEP